MANKLIIDGVECTGTSDFATSVTISPIEGMEATNVQTALEEVSDNLTSITSGSATATSGGTCDYYKCGHIVTICLGGTVTASANTNIFSGLPKPTQILNFLVPNGSTSMSYIRYTLGVDGVISNVQALSSFTQRISFTYISVD